MVRWLGVLSLLLVASGAAAFAQSRVECNALNSRILREPVHYCVLLPSSYGAPASASRRYPVLYFLHGLGDNEQTLFKSGGWTLVDDLQQENKLGEFVIVAPEGKGSFYINSANGKFRYNDFFLQEFMPYIEARYRIAREREGRAISGLSMGGYGALRMAFAHPELFSSVSAQSAALITASPAQLDKAGESSSFLTGALTRVFGNPIRVAHWNANSPLLLARKNAARLRTIAIYFNCGDEDDYGFDKGAAALDRELTRQRVPHEYHLYPGDHSPMYFLDHILETMKFHSRHFPAQGRGRAAGQ